MTPDGWSRAAVGELFDLQLGKMLNGAATDQEPQFPYLGNREVQWGRLDFSALRTMHFNAQEQQKFRLQPGDLLVCEGGEVGRTALWKGEFECFYQKAIHRLRVASRAVTPEFMFYFMSFAADNGLLSELTSQSSIAHLTREKLALLQVTLPPVSEQRKIADILAAVDEVIEKTEAVIESLQTLKKAMMQELLTRGLPGRHTTFKQTQIGEIPDEWEVVSIGQVATVGNGSTPSKANDEYWTSGTIPWLPTGKVNDVVIRQAESFVTPRALAECSIRLLPVGTILMAMIGQGKTRGKVAFLAMEACINQNFAYILPAGRLRSWFAFYYLDWKYEALRSSGRGSNQDAMNCGIIRKFTMPLPPLEEQDAIIEALASLREREQHEHAVLGQQKTVKFALISALLTGELRVTADEGAA